MGLVGGCCLCRYKDNPICLVSFSHQTNGREVCSTEEPTRVQEIIKYVPRHRSLGKQRFHNFLLQKQNFNSRYVSSFVFQKDDHDYGKNNGGKEYFNKKESKRVYLEFLDEPKDSVRWQREGIYGSYLYGPEGRRVKIILLDTRYFKESEREGDDETRDMLGEEQWKWLREELSNDDEAQVTLIGSGIQILPYDKPFQEKWSNFPASRQRLFDTIRDTRASGVVLLSGDVHYAEIFRNNCTGVGYPLYEITSSGLTHSMNTHIPFGLDAFVLNGLMKSKLRVKDVYAGFNFGTIEIDWHEDDDLVDTQTRIHLRIHDVDGKVRVEEVLELSLLTPEGASAFNESVREECRQGEIAARWTRWSLETWLEYVKYFAVILFLFIILLVAVVPLLSSYQNRKKQE